MSWDIEGFKQKLESEHAFPGPYTFKFIVPKAGLKEVAKLAEGVALKERASREGNYSSVTFKLILDTSEDVVKVYEEAFKIEGCIAL